jgi:hypothetical protein
MQRCCCAQKITRETNKKTKTEPKNQAGYPPKNEMKKEKKKECLELWKSDKQKMKKKQQDFAQTCEMRNDTVGQAAGRREWWWQEEGTFKKRGENQWKISAVAYLLSLCVFFMLWIWGRPCRGWKAWKARKAR